MAIDGKWTLTIKTPMGEQTGTLTLKQEGDALTGEMAGAAGTTAPVSRCARSSRRPLKTALSKATS